MISRKICLLGAHAVGKTSLVRRFVESIFSDKYLTTIGVKIDKKELDCNGAPVRLMIWDIGGVESVRQLRPNYLRGASGVMMVVDGTRPDTLGAAVNLKQQTWSLLGMVPTLTLLNKSDLTDDWRLESNRIESLRSNGWRFIQTSAKTGENVELAFSQLTTLLLSELDPPTGQG